MCACLRTPVRMDFLSFSGLQEKEVLYFSLLYLHACECMFGKEEVGGGGGGGIFGVHALI